MKPNSIQTTIILAAILMIAIFASTACGSGSPMEPTSNPPADVSVASIPPSGPHSLLGIWEFVIVPEVGIVDAIPIRAAEAHYDITKISLNNKLCPSCVTFQFGNIENGGKQDFTVILQNNYVGDISGYDLKGIVLADRITDSTPPYQSPWNLLNPDDYTSLGGSGVYSNARNPFKAFRAEDPLRELGVNETSSLMFQLLFPPAPVDWRKITVAWALDACESNCPEPYAIENQAIAGGIVPVLGETAQISMDVRDHQDDTASVLIDTVPLGGGGGGAYLDKEESGDLWTGDISASDDTSPGEYALEIEASDSIEKAVGIWDYITVTVGLSLTQQALFDDIKDIIADWDPDLADSVIEELADALDTTPDTIDTLITDFISDVEGLLDGPDTGDTLGWKVLLTLKELVADLGDLDIDTTMRDLIDELRAALDKCKNGSWGWSGTTHVLPGGSCTLDIGVIGGGAMSGQVLYTGNSPNCDQIRMYSTDYSSNNLYKSLVNLDPNMLGFQPWPVVRLDATNDGAFSWTNENFDYYNAEEYGFQPIRISNIWCTDDNVPAFHFIPQDDSRIFPIPVPPPQSNYSPADVCDDFDLLQYALVVDPTLTILPHIWGLMGSPQGKDYTKLDDRYGVLIPMAMVGPNDGQIEPSKGDIAGIDAYGTSATTARFFVAENGGQWALECFGLTDKGAGLGADTIVAVYTVHFDTRPLDVELIPTNPDYEQNPNCPTVAVLMTSLDGTGYVSLHRATDGALVQTIGTAQNGAVDNQAKFLDVNDANGDIHVMQIGPQVTIFSLSWTPGQ